MVSNRTLIVECGVDRVVLGAFCVRRGRLTLRDFVIENFSTDHIGRDTNWLENTRTGLRALAHRAKISGPAVFVLPPHLTLTKLIKIPRVEPAQREKIIRFEAEQNIPYALADVVWGSVIVGETATELEVLLATAKREVLEPLCAAANEAGFEPFLLMPAAFATLAGFKLAQYPTPETFLGLNLASRTTTLLLVEPGRFAVRTFALGVDGNAAQTAIQGVAVIDAVESITTKLLQEVTRSLLHFQWRSGMSKPGRIMMTGVGAYLPGLAEALNVRLSVPVLMSNLTGSIDFATPVLEKSIAAHEGTLIELIGGATTQLWPNQPFVNLLPPHAMQRVNFRRRRPWLIAAAVLAMTVLLPPLIHFRQLRDEALKKTAAIERELKPWRKRAADQREKVKQLGEVNDRIHAIREISERRGSWLRLLADLQARLARVEDVWLDKLQVVSAARGEPIKLMVSGRLLDRIHPLANASPETVNRVKNLLIGMADSPWVASVDGERFDSQQPGILKFDFVLTVDSRWPL